MREVFGDVSFHFSELLFYIGFDKGEFKKILEKSAIPLCRVEVTEQLECKEGNENNQVKKDEFLKSVEVIKPWEHI